MLAVGGLAVVVLRDGGSGGDGNDGDDGGYEPQIREELLDGVRSSPECPDAPEAPAPAAGEVVVTAVRVVDGCLAYSGEAVAESQVDARLRELRADPDVVAADRVIVRTPGSERSQAGRGRPAGDDPVDQWALAPEHLDGAKARELWPAGAPEVRVATIDTGIDETPPASTTGRPWRRPTWRPPLRCSAPGNPTQHRRPSVRPSPGPPAPARASLTASAPTTSAGACSTPPPRPPTSTSTRAAPHRRAPVPTSAPGWPTSTPKPGMISPEQKAALRTATVDIDQVSALGGRVEVPAAAVVADVAFTDSDLGDYTLAHQDGNWFIVE